MLLFVQLCIHVHMYTRYSHLKRKSLAIYDTAHSDCKRSLQSPSHLHTSHMCPRHSSCRYFSTWLILNQIESLIRTSSTFTLSGQNASPLPLIICGSRLNWRPLPHRGLPLLFLASLYCDSHLLLFLLFERVQLRVITPMLGTERGHINMTDLSRVRIIPLNQWYSTFHILAS